GRDFVNFWQYGIAAWEELPEKYYDPYWYNARLDRVCPGNLPNAFTFNVKADNSGQLTLINFAIGDGQLAIDLIRARLLLHETAALAVDAPLKINMILRVSKKIPAHWPVSPTSK
ncbi:MAG: hypothetical protein GY761_02855, partial [Hyphomicrobiales bacterium]|nr:hypothetical protein [Hyphomicrobiales bacterium]